MTRREGRPGRAEATNRPAKVQANHSAPRLSLPEIVPDADNLTAALAYAEAGLYVLPVKRGTKNPGSIVCKKGEKRWQDKSSRDPKVITAWFAGTDHGIALHCGRSGSLVFDVDHPDKLPEILRRHLKFAPYQSTRPDQPGRGHYAFAMPLGRNIGNGTGSLGGAWGQVRGLNGVIIAAPTVHPEGGEYRWQRVGPVPVLPDEIADMLDDATPASDAASDAMVTAFVEQHTAASRPELIHGWKSALSKRIDAGESRHDSAVKVTVGAMKEAHVGYLSARSTLVTLRQMFLDAVAKPPSSDKQGPGRTGATAVSEWRGIVAWAVGQALAADLDDVRQRVQRVMPDADDSAIELADSDESLDDAKSLEDIEAGFWDRRESLRIIYTAALSRMCSPWAVLGVCAAMVLALVPPSVVLPPLIGGEGSLNWFCALAALSGGGKNAAMDVADDLIKQSVLQFNIGSGEGMVEAYRRPKNAETGEPAGQHESIMFVADEIDTLAALKNRNGSTLAGMLRSAFTGATLGFTTKASNGFHLKRHDYRLTLIIGVQPARAAAILDDAGAGTPQRIMWFPATDKRVRVEHPQFPGELTVPSPVTSDKWRYGAQLEIPTEARDAILQARARSQRGEGDPLDSHSLFVREKFAYALAVLDSRDHMTSQDWELAGIAMRVSDHTRTWVIQQRERAETEEAIQQGRVQGVRRAAADDEQAHQEATRRNRIATGIVEKLTTARDEGLNERDLEHKFNNRDRRWVKPILISLADQKTVARIDRKTKDRTDRWAVLDGQ